MNFSKSTLKKDLNNNDDLGARKVPEPKKFVSVGEPPAGNMLTSSDEESLSKGLKNFGKFAKNSNEKFWPRIFGKWFSNTKRRSTTCIQNRTNSFWVVSKNWTFISHWKARAHFQLLLKMISTSVGRLPSILASLLITWKTQTTHVICPLREQKLQLPVTIGISTDLLCPEIQVKFLTSRRRFFF